ncbi:hypothetical protein VTI74DRAFT_2854 [Chaetomium olivicolor]
MNKEKDSAREQPESDAGEPVVQASASPSVPEKGTSNVVPAGLEPAAEASVDAQPESPRQASAGPIYSVFSKGTRRWVILMASFASFVSPMTVNIYLPALGPIAADLGVSVNLINLTLTTYMVSQAIAPTIMGDLGDMAGRRPAFMLCFTIYIFANLGLALQNNYPALMVLRMLQSTGSSATLSLAYAVVADLAVTAERGKYMGFVGAGINVGPALSPVFGGLLAEYLGWRAIFWFCLIYAAAWLIPYSMTVPETCRKVVGNGSVPARGWNMTALDFFRRRRTPHPPNSPSNTPNRKFRFPNPLNSARVVLEKDLALLLLYNSLMYLVFILIATTLPTDFASIYRLTDLQVGLCFLPYGVGCCLAALIQGYILDTNYRLVARKIGFTIDYKRGDDLRHFPIERARLQPVLPILSAGVAAVVCYGWVLHFETSIAGPLVLLFVVGLCVTGSFSILSTLLVDLYPDAPATAVAANNLVRCLFGAAGAAFIESMLRALGKGWTFTFWAVALVVFSPVLWVLTVKGPSWRERRRLRKLEREERDAAAAAASGSAEANP